MFSIVENVLCIVFGSNAITESDSNMIKVVKEPLERLIFLTCLNNDVITRTGKVSVRFGSLS